MEVIVGNENILVEKVDIIGDGACLFNMLSMALYSSQEHSLHVRQQIVNYVLENFENYKQFLIKAHYQAARNQDDILLHSDENNIAFSATEYSTYMLRPYSYGTFLELTVASTIFQRRIYSFEEIRPSQGRPHLRFFQDVGDHQWPIIITVLSGDRTAGHFELLQPVYFPRSLSPQTHSQAINYSEEFPPLPHINNNQSVGVQSYIKKAKKPRSKVTNKKRRENNKKAVEKYAEAKRDKNPEVNRDNVMRNSEESTEVNKSSVDDSENLPLKPKIRKRFTDIKKRKRYKEAAKKYTAKNPELNRETVKRYREKKSEVIRKTVKICSENNPEVHRESVRRYKNPWKNKAMSGFNYDLEIDYANDKIVSLGGRTPCLFCKAEKGRNETPGFCCNNGRVQLSSIEQYPEPLHSLLTDSHPKSAHFLNNLRKYNSCFQMTSFGGKEIREGNFMPTFKVQGQVYHRIGSLLPTSVEDASFLQIYFVGDEQKETALRCKNFPSLNSGLVSQLQLMLHENNPYIKDFKTSIENVQEGEDFKVVIKADRKPSDAHKGRFNRPTVPEVALVIVGQEFERRDIILHGRDSNLQRVSELHRSYDALQYPLMFCRGEDGYSINIPQRDPSSKDALNKTVSASDFYTYMLMERKDEINYISLFRNLLNQYLVDMYAKIETERLNYIRNNQSILRAENYEHLRDAICRADGQVSDVGQMVVLPSSFTGGPRYMHERTQDAMTYVRKYGRPELFITFTCNPKWTQIQDALLPGQQPQDRNDIIGRIFYLKVKTLMHLLTKEIPDPEADPTLYEIVKATMIHGPCGSLNSHSPCMLNGSCSKRYPRPFCNFTQTADDGYPQYRRRSPADGGFTVTINGIVLDNRWVVPYNPVLLRIFLAHINVELCNSIKCIKYLCKYVNKGSDQAAFVLENRFDEVPDYLVGRYISSSEAVWRIFCFPIHERYPPVMHLAVHLENCQRVYFTADNISNKLQNPPMTTLLAFFELCKVDSFAKQLLYCDVSAYYIWTDKKFRRRKQGKPVPNHPGVKQGDVIGRVYTVHPNNAECYYLRLLLHEVHGPTSFTDLKTVSGVVHPTYQSACRALGLLEDDAHWERALLEAALSDSAHKMRLLFAVMLAFCQLANPLVLWEKFKDDFSEDIKRQVENECRGISDINNEHCMSIVYNRTLLLLEQILFSMCNQSLEQFGLPSPTPTDSAASVNRQYLRELSYDINELALTVHQNVPKLNEEQRRAYDIVLSSIQTNAGQLFFLDAPGGTGKTFLLNLLLASVRKNQSIAISVASSGIAATLLDGGKTAHSAFKLPLNLNYAEKPMCNISKQSDTAKVLQECHLIVWDECTMAHKGGLEALDRTLQDIRSNNNVMGGVTVLLAGDFRQTLPVVPRGTRADEVRACIKSSYLWRKVKVLSLRVNMRVYLITDRRSEEFSNLLLSIGNGNLTEEDGKVQLPDNLCSMVKDLDTLCNTIYPDLINISRKDTTWLKERAILTPKNDLASDINDLLLSQLTTEPVKYQSVDTVVELEDAIHYPVEFLNTLNPPGIPPHHLSLKIGAPIMLLRNLIPPKLCNGTRLQVKALHRNVIEATIFTGCGTGETVYIPRIPLISSDYQFQFKRVQFPVKLCFAMTINKSQGQSLKLAGVDLRHDCFSHGQLYVACSRVSTPASLVILQPEGKTKNIVYYEVLDR